MDAPFHVVHKKFNDTHIGYDIYCCNLPFLSQANAEFPLKRHEAYAICKLLNSERRGLKWEDKFKQ